MRVEVAVADAAAVYDQRMVEQIAVAVGRRFQPLQQIAEELDVLLVDLRYLGDLFRVVLVVSEVVMPVGDSDRAIWTVAALASPHQDDTASKVGLVRDGQQIQYSF